jgi:hypothetical protein
METFCGLAAENDPVSLWTHMLNSETVVWGTEMKRLIQTLLAIPISTADVERGFSILTHTKSDRRNRLSVENLRHLLFMRVNGPEPEHLDAIRYAKKWISSGHMATDDPRQERKKNKERVTGEQPVLDDIYLVDLVGLQ